VGKGTLKKKATLNDSRDRDKKAEEGGGKDLQSSQSPVKRKKRTKFKESSKGLEKRPNIRELSFQGRHPGIYLGKKGGNIHV